jgi:glycosyltransferase involved in cell wall biosynthesis
MNIVHIATRMTHHSNHSGYDRLSEYIQCEKFKSGWITKCMSLIPNRIWGLLLRKSKFYLVPELKREIDLQMKSLFCSETIFHFLYGENDFRIFYPTKRNKLFVTYHLPPNKYRQYFTKPKNLNKVNAIIVVGSNQIEYFSEYILKEKILFIHHGVDTEYFKPMENGIRNNKILFVGTHLRDFNLLKEVIERIEKLSINLFFTIITFKENWKIFQGLKKIKLLSYVSENRLLKYYQNHALLFLPLIDGTANNTLLEAGACGLPIITSNVGGVRDYLDDKSAIILNSKNIEMIVTIIMDIMDDEKKRNELSINVRNKMLSYDWKIIAKKMMEVYEVF